MLAVRGKSRGVLYVLSVSIVCNNINSNIGFANGLKDKQTTLSCLTVMWKMVQIPSLTKQKKHP